MRGLISVIWIWHWMNRLLLMAVLLKSYGSQILSFSARHQKSATKLSDQMICYECHRMVKYFYELVTTWLTCNLDVRMSYWPIQSSTIYDWNGVRYEFSTFSIWLSTMSDTFRKKVSPIKISISLINEQTSLRIIWLFNIWYNISMGRKFHQIQWI